MIIQGYFDYIKENLICVFQASFLNKKINIRGARCNLSIWDTAGQERFHALGPIYYRDANGAILIYDITDADSFQKVTKLYTDVILIQHNPDSLCPPRP